MNYSESALFPASLGNVPVRKLAGARTLREAVADQIRTEIVIGNLKPGALLKENDVALQLGVSATPVREAFMILASEGLVEIESHRLKRVAPLDLPATFNMLRVQSALWRMGYVWSLPRLGNHNLAALEVAVATYKTALSRREVLAAILASHEFHTVFIQASRNLELLRVTLDRRALIARFILLRGSSSISPAGLRQHRAILEAARHGEAEAALAHLDLLADKLIALASPDRR